MLSRSYGRVLYMANPLTRQDVNRIAELAHLQLSNEEAELFTRQLGDILRYAERLQEVDTTAVEMKNGNDKPVDRRRTDHVRPSLSREDTLNNAPDSKELTDQERGGYFRVPRVIG
ncbi:Asp-tRNA(Asn)/Glu-tRNA(Gln) amidotransferase subunit GatC [bacterium]|nr:MAG: Asp-tRNA(Asn)/Glu-tRNA(Gln) amidotransferase subunit GatC [bacterium]